MSKSSLTANQTAVLDSIRQGFFIEEGDFVAVFDTFAADLADRGTIKDKKTAKVVLNQLTKKRLLAVDADEILTLTDAGKYAITEILFADDPEELAAQEAHLASLENEAKQDAPVVEETYLEATDEDLIGETEKAVSETDTYTVTEWTDADDVEWTETIFKDGSKTLKRRKKVSGSWRTDYWGTEVNADKQIMTTAKAAKMARAYGSFTSVI